MPMAILRCRFHFSNANFLFRSFSIFIITFWLISTYFLSRLGHCDMMKSWHVFWFFWLSSSLFVIVTESHRTKRLLNIQNIKRQWVIRLFSLVSTSHKQLLFYRSFTRLPQMMNFSSKKSLWTTILRISTRDNNTFDGMIVIEWNESQAAAELFIINE